MFEAERSDVVSDVAEGNGVGGCCVFVAVEDILLRYVYYIPN